MKDFKRTYKYLYRVPVEYNVNYLRIQGFFLHSPYVPFLLKLIYLGNIRNVFPICLNLEWCINTC